MQVPEGGTGGREGGCEGEGVQAPRMQSDSLIVRAGYTKQLYFVPINPDPREDPASEKESRKPPGRLFGMEVVPWEGECVYPGSNYL